MPDTLNATEIAVGSLLAGGVGGRGGAWGGYHEGCNTFANPAANAVRIDRNADVSNLSFGAARDFQESNFRGISSAFDTATRAGEFARVCEKIGEVDNRGADQRFQAELRTNDRLLALQAEINENARVAAQCCCDIKLQACEDKAQVLAAIAGNESRAIERALNNSQAELISLRTQVACGCHCPTAA
jgi:hypothetical protein